MSHLKSKKNYTIALIPARGGSKGIPKKNIIDILGFPLIVYSIAAAKLAQSIDRIIVSTDSEEIASIAKKYGAEVPFMRPKELAQDHSVDREFVTHALDWFNGHEHAIPDYIVHLRPTIPLRVPRHIDEAIKKITEVEEATSLRSAHKVREVPFKDFQIENGFFTGLFPDDPRPEYYNLPRQSFPQTYHSNGYIDILKSSFVRAGESLHGEKILPLITEETEDIDTVSNQERVIDMLKKKNWEIYEYLQNNF